MQTTALKLLFLPEDYEELLSKIKEHEHEERAHGAEAGESCRQTSETWHDNFALDQAKHNLAMTRGMLSTLLSFRNSAEKVEPSRQTQRVEIGNIVRLECLLNGEVETFLIGSHRSYAERSCEVLAYDSPLGALLMGLAVGDETKEQKLEGGRTIKYRILAIDLS